MHLKLGWSLMALCFAARSHMRQEGRVVFNGRPLTKRLRRSIGFVLQDDLLYENLTVYETLYYAAMLRLPREMPDADKVARVNAVIAALGIESCRNTIIGARRSCMLTHHLWYLCAYISFKRMSCVEPCALLFRLMAVCSGFCRHGGMLVWLEKPTLSAFWPDLGLVDLGHTFDTVLACRWAQAQGRVRRRAQARQHRPRDAHQPIRAHAGRCVAVLAGLRVLRRYGIAEAFVLCVWLYCDSNEFADHQ